MSPASNPKARSAWWQQHINHCNTSGLSGVQYCQQHQLTYHCFLYWRRKLSDTPVEHKAGGKLPPHETASAFVTVQAHAPATVTQQGSDGGGLQLALPNGLIIRNIHDGNLSTVRPLLACL